MTRTLRVFRPRADRHDQRYDPGMVRRTRIAVAAAVAAGALSGAALAPAAGDQRTTGGQRVSYTDDGIPYVSSGFECKAGKGAHKAHEQTPADASDY
jgi:hypothetical protein